jgi:hypothetical protein
LKTIDRRDFHCIKRPNAAALLEEAHLRGVRSDDANIHGLDVPTAF